MTPERISLELTNQCSKGCDFCYNTSTKHGRSLWQPDDVIAFISDCASNGTKAVSLGGGEPFEYDGLFEILHGLKGKLFRSLTTNGLHLRKLDQFEQLVAAQPDKVHVSIHFPENAKEVERVVDMALRLGAAGIVSGINFLVQRSKLTACVNAAEYVRQAGIANERIVYLPMRHQDTPSPNEIAQVAGGVNFQSMTCLAACAVSPRFCSIGWDRRIAWCSYTEQARYLETLSAQHLSDQLHGLGLSYCGLTEQRRDETIVEFA